MKILISGGTGLIGRHFIQSRKNDEFFVLTRNKKAHQLSGNVTMVGWDGKTLGDWAQIVNEVDVILNLAGENIGDKRWTDSQRERIILSRVQSGNVLIQAVLASRPPTRFVYSGFRDWDLWHGK